jgi:hypothetical protein
MFKVVVNNNGREFSASINDDPETMSDVVHVIETVVKSAFPQWRNEYDIDVQARPSRLSSGVPMPTTAMTERIRRPRPTVAQSLSEDFRQIYGGAINSSSAGYGREDVPQPDRTEVTQTNDDRG